MQKIIVIVLITTTLFSCSEPQSNNDQANKEHLLSDQQKMIQKAKNTEKLIHEADEKRRQALEEQGG